MRLSPSLRGPRPGLGSERQPHRVRTPGSQEREASHLHHSLGRLRATTTDPVENRRFSAGLVTQRALDRVPHAGTIGDERQHRLSSPRRHRVPPHHAQPGKAQVALILVLPKRQEDPGRTGSRAGQSRQLYRHFESLIDEPLSMRITGRGDLWPSWHRWLHVPQGDHYVLNKQSVPPSFSLFSAAA
jgi:hypothetical protein